MNKKKKNQSFSAVKQKQLNTLIRITKYMHFIRETFGFLKFFLKNTKKRLLLLTHTVGFCNCYVVNTRRVHNLT